MKVFRDLLFGVSLRAWRCSKSLQGQSHNRVPLARAARPENRGFHVQKSQTLINPEVCGEKHRRWLRPSAAVGSVPGLGCSVHIQAGYTKACAKACSVQLFLSLLRFHRSHQFKSAKLAGTQSAM